MREQGDDFRRPYVSVPVTLTYADFSAVAEHLRWRRPPTPATFELEIVAYMGAGDVGRCSWRQGKSWWRLQVNCEPQPTHRAGLVTAIENEPEPTDATPATQGSSRDAEVRGWNRRRGPADSVLPTHSSGGAYSDRLGHSIV